MKISVCLATYNGGKYIKEQLDSIISQLGIADEIIISDDGSTDNTLDVIKELNESRIKIVINTLEKGYSKNFENAISHASGDIIFLSDQDDVWMGDKVEKMQKALGEADLVISDALISDGDLNPTLGSHFNIHKVRTGFLHNWIQTRYIGACMAFRKEILKKIMPFPSNQKLCAHDYWIANVGEFYYKVYLIHEPLIKYRRHNNNASTGGEKSENTILHKLKVRLYTIKELLKRI
ncbi:glycosyltransferase family 2 protein [Chryseobacterium rhizosphaerae]|uniref:glycosyltransferase family 2 protein n=1 Tax=Chryseobacterium rhizosphaerae TaxID=395937 RepID=UPI003D135F91